MKEKKIIFSYTRNALYDSILFIYLRENYTFPPKLSPGLCETNFGIISSFNFRCKDPAQSIGPEVTCKQFRLNLTPK